MKSNKTITDILKVSASNIIKLLSGVLIGLLLPKIIGVADYGYYKTFTLYIHYVGLFHFGISDGIYLLYGGKNYNELEKEKFRAYSLLFIVIEAVLSIVLVVFSFAVLNGELQFIFCCIALYLLFYNVTGYYQMISQITGRFTELSTRNVIQSLLITIEVIAFWAVHYFSNIEISYRPFTAIYTIITIVLAFWYIKTYHDITFGIKDNLRERTEDIPYFIKVGFPLTIANLCSTLILSLDRQFVNILFDMETYAVYAFAYNMLSLVTTAISAISTVLYPKLKRTETEILKTMYSSLVAVILMIVFLSLSMYYPLCVFVNWFLPKYTGSLVIFRIIFPGLAISSAITIVMHNYYKTLGVNNIFFIKSIIILVISGIANYISYAVFKTTTAISIASIITMFIWYIIVEMYFIRHYQIKWIRNFLYMVVMVLTFYLVSAIPNYYIGFIVYIVVFLVVTFVLEINNIKKIKKTF